MAPATNVLDHIIHLSPPSKLSEAVQYWEHLGFKVIPGGQHTGGLTSNALVALADGVYIELIAFDKPTSEYPPDSPRSKHWWASKEPGWLEWACLGLEDHVDQTISQREKQAGSGVEYQEGKLGGRKRASDGQGVKWRVTVPKLKHGRGTVPFFCQDITPRELRVPSADANTHLNSALGVSYIHISVPAESISRARAQLSVVLDGAPTASNEWELSVPHSSANQKLPAPRLKLLAADSGVIASSIDAVGFFTGDSKHKDVDTPVGFGKVVFVPV